MAKSVPWADEELFRAVEAYIFLLLAERAGIILNEPDIARSLFTDLLNNRNDTSLHYRMRNISAVVRDTGISALSIYPPAENVGSNVRKKIRNFLETNRQFQVILEKSGTGEKKNEPLSAERQSHFLDRLTALRVYISELERELLGVGHNNPPEPLNGEGPSRSDFEQARRDIQALEDAASKGISGEATPNRHIVSLMKFGLKVALWIGERATKFTDVTLKLLAPVVVAKVTGLTPILFDAIAAASRFFSH